MCESKHWPCMTMIFLMSDTHCNTIQRLNFCLNLNEASAMQHDLERICREAFWWMISVDNPDSRSRFQIHRPGNFQGRVPPSPHLQQQLQYKEAPPTSSFHKGFSRRLIFPRLFRSHESVGLYCLCGASTSKSLLTSLDFDPISPNYSLQSTRIQFLKSSKAFTNSFLESTL